MDSDNIATATTLDQVLAAIMRDADVGKAPDREQWLARYPQLARELTEFFADEAKVERWTAPLRAAAASTVKEAVTVGGGTAGTPPESRPCLGDYEILDEIAQGGMGVVYRARQKSLNRLVALKMIRAGEFASEADRMRFRNEAEVIAQLDHPCIVPIYDVGETEGRHFFSMKLIAGGSLAELIAGAKPATPAGDDKKAARHLQEQIAALLAAVARAVHYAHQRGILHRDLKPANILLQYAGDKSATEISAGDKLAAVPLVTDFGLAKRVEELAGEEGLAQPNAVTLAPASPLTQSGAIVGTPGYMAPEQAAGRKGLTTAADTYSLGAILYELLTGRPPFQAATPLDTLLLVREREPEAPRRLNPRLDRDLETICLKCLEKDPRRRYGSAEELARDLERWLAREPIHVRRAGTWERTVKWARRRPAAALLTGVSAASVAAVLALAGFLWHNAEARAAAVKSLDEAQSRIGRADNLLQERNQQIGDKEKELIRLEMRAARESAKAVQARLRADAILYDADMQFAHAAWESDDVARTLRLLETHRKPGPADRRSFEWHYLRQLCHDDRYTLAAHAAKGQAGAVPIPPDRAECLAEAILERPTPVLLALSPDGRTLASTSGDAEIKLWDARTGNKLRSLAGPKGIVSVDFSADGKNLAMVKLKTPGKNKIDVQLIQQAFLGQSKPSLDGLKRLFAVHTISLDGKPVRESGFEPADLPGPVSLLAASSVAAEVMIGAMLKLSDQRLFSPMVLAAAPDKKTLAIAGLVTSIGKGKAQNALPLMPEIRQQGAVLVWDLSGGGEKAILTGHDSPVFGVAFAPDGATLASAAFDGNIKLWDTKTWRQTATLPARAASCLTFSADGKTLLAGGIDGIVRLWDVNTRQVRATFKGHRNSINSVALTPDGSAVIAGCVDGTIKCWDTARPAPLQFPGKVLALAFDTDGKTLLAVDNGGVCKRFDGVLGREQASSKLSFPPGARLLNIRAVLSADGKTLAQSDSVPGAGALKLFDLTTGKERVTLKKQAASHMVFSPDGKLLAAARSGRQANNIELWDVSTAKLVRTLDSPDATIDFLAFSADGRTLASGETVLGAPMAEAAPAAKPPAGFSQRVKLWEVASGKERFVIPQKNRVSNLAFAPDGRTLAIAGGKIVKIVETANARERLSLDNDARVAAMAFSPDSKRLAVGGGETALGKAGGVKLWDLGSGREVLSLGSGQSVAHLLFSPDGRRLVAAFVPPMMLTMFSPSRPSDIKIWSAGR